ncbi:unnamed protein product [Adineta ricciae]|uniref:C2H2-type domain-containing protein n=1 Tax=Adineta ricciae TaxID=249248 RepID=A0A816C504_ADIRI|nr:unnamed protein product [Adineta ricciae]CAF1618826.1 unnamed protein product [Adineta ricciae]
MSDVKIIKPIAKYANVTGNFPLTTAIKPLAVAGTALKEGSVVYLLHQLPYNFLLTDFYDHNLHYNKIPIHGWSQHLIGPGLFQEWILAIKSARTPDEQNVELFQSTETNLFGFRTTRLVVPDEPLLAWFSLPQLRTICEKIKLTKVFKVEELLKSTRCPRCKVEQNYLNVLVAHVLLDQCHDPIPSLNLSLNERIFVHTSPSKKRLMDFSSIKRSSSPSPRSNSTNPKNEDVKEKDHHQQQQQPSQQSLPPIAFSTNDVSSYKMSVLDGTHALEFTSLDNDGRQRKAHLCLFCGKVYNRKYGLKIHLRTHTGYKPLQCRVCFRPFSDPSNLNKHIRLHSTTTTAAASSSSSSITPTNTLSSSSFVAHKRPYEEQEESNTDSDNSNLHTLDDDEEN